MKGGKFNLTLDKSVSSNSFFTRIKSIWVDKQSIFKYGIINEDVPSFISENDFEYLQSKVPSWLECYGDNVEIDKNRIINYATGENTKKISEIIGVGVSIIYSIELLKVNPNTINKIPQPPKKEKYMDFATTKAGKRYEIEAKGTIVHTTGKINALLKDIQGKKKSNDQTACKFGVITLANKDVNKEDSKIIICDDYEDIDYGGSNTIEGYLQYYKLFLSLIMDSTYYNRMMATVETEERVPKNIINLKNIKGRYVYNGITYWGEYFDKRLIADKIKANINQEITLNQLFQMLTTKEGKVKHFIGIDIRILNCINALYVKGIDEYSIKKEIIDEENLNIIQDVDGVIFVTSINDADSQISENFTEDIVKKRLGEMLDFHNHQPHKCGAACRSREKEGEACEILTYREHCHFHR